MTLPASRTPIFLHDLRLATAHALVMQEGGDVATLAEGEPAPYVQALIDGLCELSLKDPLTGLANRRFLYATLDREIDRVTRAGDSALLMMLDIDHFKSINDAHGHLAGDLVLQSVARTLSACVRPMDTVARYGGEEFAVVLPSCQATFARAVAERMRRAIETTPVRISPVEQVNVTVSVGGDRSSQQGDERDGGEHAATRRNHLVGPSGVHGLTVTLMAPSSLEPCAEDVARAFGGHWNGARTTSTPPTSRAASTTRLY